MKHLLSTLIFLSCGLIEAKEIYVDFASGRDTNPGSQTAPFQSFATALNQAQPGDTIYLSPSVRPLSISLKIKNKQGSPERPIIIDGRFNTLIGTRPVSPNQWEEVKPGSGLYCRQLPRPPSGHRFFMRFNDRMERMGRHTKWKDAPLPRPDELQNLQWTLVGADKCYFKLPPGGKFADYNVEEPDLCNGVELSGNCANLVVRNLIAKSFWNDGFNLHGNCRNIRFENIAALENGDDGISAHETCRFKVTNMLSIGNGTGFCHIQQAEGEHENIYIAAADSRDIYLKNAANSLTNVIVEGNSPGGIVVDSGKTTVKNCRFVNSRPNARLTIKTDHFHGENILIAGYRHGTLPTGIASDDPVRLLTAAKTLRQRLFALFTPQSLLEKAP